MTRDELKGKQTRGTDYRAYNENGIGLGMIVENNGVITAHCVKWEPTEQNANAALYAEAHNVANETMAKGKCMWPKDLEQRVKELEEALDTLTLVVGLTPIAGNKDALQEATNNARAILNKKP